MVDAAMPDDRTILYAGETARAVVVPIEHDLPFDPAHGHTMRDLLAVMPPGNEPDDFAAFWLAQFERTAALPLDLTVRPSALSTEAVAVFDVTYTSLEGRRIGGWLTVPELAPARYAVVAGHGYGGRDAPALRPDVPAIRLYPCARGFHRSAADDLPADAHTHVIAGLEDRDRYIHLGCCADMVWRAADALLQVHPEMAGRLFYQGSSFGGGIGAMALPWDARYGRAFLGVPSFGHHPLRMTCRMTGSGASVATRYAQDRAVLDTLAYYDAATAARYLHRPTMVCAARFDPGVPPPGQVCVYNALPGRRRLLLRTAAHFPGRWMQSEEAAVQQAMDDWFDEHEEANDDA